MPVTRPIVAAETARRMLLGGAELLADPGRGASPARLRRTCERLGFVQVDTISVAGRAHHHILASRHDDYRAETLTRLLERDRALFEHWTHDASIIPTVWYPWWRHRFERHRRTGVGPGTWWHRRMNGEPCAVLRRVRARIRRDGPLMSRDFATADDGTTKRNAAWWGWGPSKAALEFLWRTGELAVAGRVNFHKVYDLAERVFPELHAAPRPHAREHVDWACRTALSRLGFATPREIAGFLAAVSAEDARAWCRRAVAAGDAEEVTVTSADGSAPRAEYALAGWRRRAARLADPPDRMRLLSPFDPVLRDRARALRRFGFDYRFEAFVPAARRRYGYYVLPLLEGDRLVGRLDPKLHRRERRLEVRGLWWEPGIRVTAARRRRLDDALERYAQAFGADDIDRPTAARRAPG